MLIFFHNFVFGGACRIPTFGNKQVHRCQISTVKRQPSKLSCFRWLRRSDDGLKLAISSQWKFDLYQLVWQQFVVLPSHRCRSAVSSETEGCTIHRHETPDTLCTRHKVSPKGDSYDRLWHKVWISLCSCNQESQRRPPLQFKRMWHQFYWKAHLLCLYVNCWRLTIPFPKSMRSEVNRDFPNGKVEDTGIPLSTTCNYF